jgi:hypothetical protein
MMAAFDPGLSGAVAFLDAEGAAVVSRTIVPAQ